MRRRFLYEWRKSLPFFLLLMLIATVLWLFLRSSVANSENLEQFLFPMMIAIPVVLAMVCLAIGYVVLNFSREFSSEEGVLTFLTPVAPWKIMLAKWLNFIVSFAIAFLYVRALMTFLPESYITSGEILTQLRASMADEGALQALTAFVFGMSPVGVAFFVMRWTLVLMLGYWVLARTEALATSGHLAHGKNVLRVVLLIVFLVAIDQALYRLSEMVPWFIESHTFQIFQHAPLKSLQFGYVQESSAWFFDEAERMWQGLPLVAVVFTLVATVFFLWRANVAWNQIDR